jgi:hypothetical protein
MSRAGALLVSMALILVGCGNDERPAIGPGPDAGEPDGAADAAPPSTDGGPRIRTVETRNPFGEALADNLLVDGDFELTSGSGQYGWRASGAAGEVPLLRETGGLCRSGVICGILTPDADFLGFAAAPKDQSVEVRIWTKPPVPDCEVTVLSVINCTGVIVSNLGTVPATTLEPDATGWCEHHATLPPISVRPCLFVSSLAEPDSHTLVDQGSFRPVAGATSNALAAGPPSSKLYQRMARALDAANGHPRFGQAAPTSP